MTDCFEHGNEPWVSIKGDNFVTSSATFLCWRTLFGRSHIIHRDGSV